jgi:hypothetical protein
MLKKYITKGLPAILVVGLTFSACNEDFLNRYPESSLNEKTFWKTEKDAKMGLVGCYRWWEDYANIIWFDALTDNAKNPFDARIPFMALGEQSPYTTWDFFEYGGGAEASPIRRCNDFLKNIENVADISETLKQQYIAEVKFIRAYDYARKTALYGDVPLVTKPLSPTEAEGFVKSPKSEVVTYILKDLADAIPNLPVDAPETGRITKGAALALKARIELYNEKWDDAAASAKALMDLKKYSLMQKYEAIFWQENENNQEVILDIPYVRGTYWNQVWQHIMPHSEGGWSAVVPTQKLVDSYICLDGKTIDQSTIYNPDKPYEKRDPRLHYTIICPGDPWNGRFMDPFSAIDQYVGGNNMDNYAKWSQYGSSITGFHLRKWNNANVTTAELNDGGLNIILFRYAEVLLTYAEAMFESGKITQQVLDQTINLLRDRAYVRSAGYISYPKVQVSDTNLRDIIRNERRMELAMEGLRWYDIVRWKIAENVMPGDVYGARIGKVDKTTGKVTYEGDKHIFVEKRTFDPSKNYLFAIPQYVIDNSKGSITQNNNY